MGHSNRKRKPDPTTGKVCFWTRYLEPEEEEKFTKSKDFFFHYKTRKNAFYKQSLLECVPDWQAFFVSLTHSLSHYNGWGAWYLHFFWFLKCGGADTGSWEKYQTIVEEGGALG